MSTPPRPDDTMTLEEAHRYLLENTFENYPTGVPIPSQTSWDHPIIAASPQDALRTRILQHSALLEEAERELPPDASEEEIMKRAVELLAQRDMQRRAAEPQIRNLVINQWDIIPRTINILECRNGGTAYWPTSPTSRRFTALLEGMMLRTGAVTVEAELKAQEALFARLTERQRHSYIVNNAFIELSTRSGVHYMLRKGLPVVAMTGDKRTGRMKILAALCVHGMGYFDGTPAGCLPPSDDVLFNLLLIRSGEHYYWRKCGQYPPWDWRAFM